jgi:hypothetical protein
MHYLAKLLTLGFIHSKRNIMTHRIFFLAILLILLQGRIIGQENIIFEENFNDNSNEWGEMDNDDAYDKVQNGKYIFEHKRTELSWYTSKLIQIDTQKDFSISCNTLWSSGIENNSYDLVWGMSNPNNCYSFGISANGYYRYCVWIAGSVTNLIKWTASDYINKNGSNRLSIKKKGSTIEFYINENKVNQTNFDSFFGDRIGFCIYQNQKILFDDLKIAYLGNTVAVSDNTAPEISIFEPSVNRGLKIVEANKQILVKGRATDDSGIYEVTINGLNANVNSNGDFQQYVRLAVGDNTITVKATDTKNNSGTYTFYINRQEPENNDVVVEDNPVNTNERRLALVIGNSNYGGGQTLKNPANDATLMATTLQGLGFEVIKRIDANKQSMEQAIRDFSKKLPNCNVALFYYAGHGVQVDGQNYLVPTDAKLNDKSDCKFEAISVNYVVEEFERYPDNVNIVILDACRNNPFRSWARGGERGFKAIPPTSGTIIAFATSEGSTASDGTGNNGLFTEQLVKQMFIKQPIESVFKKTRVEVENKSNGAQSPQEWSKLKGDFYFKKQ